MTSSNEKLHIVPLIGAIHGIVKTAMCIMNVMHCTDTFCETFGLMSCIYIDCFGPNPQSHVSFMAIPECTGAWHEHFNVKLVCNQLAFNTVCSVGVHPHAIVCV